MILLTPMVESEREIDWTSWPNHDLLYALFASSSDVILIEVQRKLSEVRASLASEPDK